MRIGVLRGGKSSEYEDSLQTGEYVLSLLREQPEKFQPVDIFVSKEGDWHVSGIKKSPAEAIKHLDMVFLAVHDSGKEISSAQKVLSTMHMPYVGSKTLGNALSTNKDIAKELYVSSGLLTPKHTLLYGNVSLDNLIHVFRTYLPPVIVKPAYMDSVTSSKLAHTFEELKEFVADALDKSDKVLIEEYVKGKEAVCGVIENFREQKLYALLPQPSSFSVEEHKQMEGMAKKAHEILGLRHYSLSKFVITPKGKIYILETSAQPKLSKDSTFIKSLSAIGVKAEEFVEHLVKSAV